MNININLSATIKTHWRTISFCTISLIILIVGILIFPSKAVELRAQILQFLIPIMAIALFIKKDLLTTSIQPLPKKIKTILIILSSSAVALYILQFFFSYNILISGVPAYAKKISVLITILTILITTLLLTLTYFEAVYMKSLHRLFIPSYFVNAGIISAVCCNLGIVSNIDSIAFDLPDIYIEQILASTLHIIIGIGITFILGAIVYALENTNLIEIIQKKQKHPLTK